MAKLPPFDSTAIYTTEGPHPEWKVGEGLSRNPLGAQWEGVLKEGWKSWDMASMSPSFFNVVSNSPPILSISVLWDGANAKDTLHNIIGTKEFMMNLISEPFVEAANATAVGAPPDFDEWKIAGLTPEPSPARVKESAASFECELLSSQDIFPDDSQTPSATLVLGRIKHAYVRKAVLHDDEPVVDATNFQAVARMGGRIYARVGNLYELVMPDWREAV